MIQELFQYKVIRFILVGILNAMFGGGVYCLMIYLGLSIAWATFISNILGVLFNFKTTGRIVFKNKDNQLIFRFILCYLLLYFINVKLILFIALVCGLNDYCSGIVAIPFVAVFSFVLLNYFVFSKKKGYEEN